MRLIATLNTPRMPLVQVAKSLLPPVLWRAMYRRLVVKNIDSADCYAPHYSPWLEPKFLEQYEEIKQHTLCSEASCWTLLTVLSQALRVEGDVAEAGVYRGGTARLISKVIQKSVVRPLHLFDSFEGMKTVDAKRDRFRTGDFDDSSLDSVKAFVGNEPFIEYRKGWIPATFADVEDKTFCFAHIDVDLYQSILDCCIFFYPRMPRGGAMVFDDYGYASCPGARKAVTEFFADKLERPLILQTGQAIIFKL